MWRATKNSLPTKKNLVRLEIIANDHCELCQIQHEDVLHALCLCPKLEELWSMVPIWNYNSLRWASSFIDLIGCIFIDKRDPTLFAVVVWALWKRRNNPPLGKSCGTLGQLLTQAKNILQDFTLHNTSTVLPMGRPPTQWNPLGSSQYKISFDDTLFQAESCAGIGVVSEMVMDKSWFPSLKESSFLAQPSKWRRWQQDGHWN